LTEPNRPVVPFNVSWLRYLAALAALILVAVDALTHHPFGMMTQWGLFAFIIAVVVP